MTAHISTYTLVLRGLLTEPSGNDDNPHRRVILRPVDDLPDGPALVVDSLDPSAEPDVLRADLRACIDAYVARHGRKPTAIDLGGTGLRFVAERTEGGPPLQDRVAVVTGAAGAIGAGICHGLAQQGAHVAATDLPGERLDRLVAELDATAPGRAAGLPLDVTSREATAGALDTIIGRWGGVDIVVIVAGIAHVSSLMEMDLADFQKLERVNVDGTLLTLAEASKRLVTQATGGDVIVISSKTVPAPGAGFGAYSATKAACHQLARIASLELAEHDIRVNLVAPDAVFGEGEHKSGLWAHIGPERMKARGLTATELEAYYRDRNLLKARVTPRHVANAVLFFATRQTPTTGATLPVDGGLPDATPR